MGKIRIMINKESMDQLYDSIEKNTNLISSALRMQFKDNNKHFTDFINDCLSSIRFYMESAYDPKLNELKSKVRSYYQKWLNLKDKDQDAANTEYQKYIQLKTELDSIRYPY